MIRNVEPKDLPKLRALHEATGFQWDFPEGLLSAKVWVDANDEPRMLLGAKVIAEVVLIAGEDKPGEKLAMLEALSAAVHEDIRRSGIREAVAWLPNSIYKPFSRRLAKWGWKPSQYRTMSRGV